MGDEESLIINEHGSESENSPTTSRVNEEDEILVDNGSLYGSSDDDYETEEEEDERARTVARSVTFDRSIDAGKSTRSESHLSGKRTGSVARRHERTRSKNSISRYRTKSLSRRSHSFRQKHAIGKEYRGPIHINASQQLTPKERALQSRYKYYHKLTNSNAESREHFLMPAHIIPYTFFQFIPMEPGEKQGSLVTIFAIGNLMIGTSSLSMPWAIEQAGLVLGVGTILFMCSLCCYTALLIADLTFKYEEHHSKNRISDFSDVCNHYLGPVGKWLAVTCSLLALLGAMFAYWILMSNFLYNVVSFLYDTFHSDTGISHRKDYRDCICPHNSSYYYTCYPHNTSGLRPYSSDGVESDSFKSVWDQTKTVPFYLIVLLMPLLNMKSPTFFTKFNSMGTFSVIYVICFLILKATSWHVNLSEMHYPEDDSLILASVKFPSLSGIAMLAFFTHNAVVAVLRNQKTPKNNTRDVILGYGVGLTTYLCSGLILFLSYPIDKSCIQQNLLDNFKSSDIFCFIARVFLFFQMTAVFPLIIYLVRLQFFHSFFHTTSPSYLQIIILNFVCLCMNAMIAFLIPNIGTVTRFSGAISGAVYITFLPCVVIMVRQRSENKLTVASMILHGGIALVGILNLIAQFFI